MDKSKTPKDKNQKPAPETMESSYDPMGSYTGNPQGGGVDSRPVQDADDL